ncbi:TatD family hydrolase [Candidatus Saccharibacteria bacterium]|nr:TatD family hydrolase [Candidatus Saccharibacteria bacterium]
MMLIDTHCHIHEADYPLDRNEVLEAARAAGVEKIICIGTDIQSSRDAVDFANKNKGVFATIGLHPHDAKTIAGTVLVSELDAILAGTVPAKKMVPASSVLAKKIVGIGEIGLDYYYNHSPREAQIEALNVQIELALRHNLPINFHVREAFDDFWPIFNNFGGKIRGVLHSFTDNVANMEKALARGLFIGVNGIATFNKDDALTKVHQTLPLNRMLLETDAPFLAPPPFRSKTNQPAFIPKIVEFLAELRGETYEQIAIQTTKNATELFLLN